MTTDTMSIIGSTVECGKKHGTCLRALTIQSGDTLLKLGPKTKYELSEGTVIIFNISINHFVILTYASTKAQILMTWLT